MNLMQMIADGKHIDVSKLEMKFFIIKNSKKPEHQYALCYGDKRFLVPYEHNMWNNAGQMHSIASSINNSLSWTAYVNALKAASDEVAAKYASKHGELFGKAASSLEQLQTMIDNSTKAKIDVSKLEVIDVNDAHAVELVCQDK